MAVIKMDWQKNLLIAAILATLLMLVIRWHEFQEQRPAPAAVASQTSSSAATPTGAVPSATSEIPVAANELSEAAKVELA